MSSRLRGTLIGMVAGGLSLAVGAGAAAAEPMHIALAHRFAQPPTIAQCMKQYGVPCYQPAQFQKAYGMDRLYAAGLDGRGRTIVIVDSFGSPTIRADLKAFDRAFHLPDPRLGIIQPAGMVPPWNPGDPAMTGWAFETSLDVEYAHAMAPGANILLVETPVAETEGTVGFPQIVAAETYVIDRGMGDVITQSFGATEETFPSPASIFQLRGAYKNAAAHGVTVLASSGDLGPTDFQFNGADTYPFRVVSWPSSDPLVTSVGGTQLHLDERGNRLAPDNVWNDTAMFGSPAASGGGDSHVFRRPGYQNSVAAVVGSMRGTPDISLSAAVNGAATVYLGYPAIGQPAGWYITGGTSEASPLFSGIVAIADQAVGHRLGLVNPALYSIGSGAPGITDITRGNNTVFFVRKTGVKVTVPGYDAVPGYDLATGLGTPNGRELVTELGFGGF